MRSAFLALLLANLAFFAWWRYASPPDAGLDPKPLARQIEPDKLRIVPQAELAKPPAPKKPAPPPPAPAAVAAPVPAPATACLEWGSFTLADAPKMEKALEPLALGTRLGQRATQETAGWWVFMPSQGNRQAAQRKAAELKGLGVEEYFVLAEEGPYRWGLSLGVFRTEEAARARLAALRTQGVRTAQVGPREMTVPKLWLQVSGVDAALEARLKEIAAGVEGSELKPCP